MFSGIIEEKARVLALQRGAGAASLTIESGLDHSRTQPGDSIAVDGACLTVVERRGGVLRFDLSEETLRRGTLGRLSPGDAVNVERSLQLGARIHGHLVYGHVDGTAVLRDSRPEGGGLRLEWEFPARLRPYIVEKGSIAIAGVSLTVGEMLPESFATYIVPHTLRLTTLEGLRPGHAANIEVDMLARYVESMLARAELPAHGVTMEFLREHGYASRDER